MDFTELLNLLAKRRLGLSQTQSLDNVCSKNCEEIGSLHIACILHKNNVPYCISTNIYKNYNGIYSYHAENQALAKLSKNKRSNPKSINLFVIRVTRHGNIVNSKPCIKCLQDMLKLPSTKGYKVKNIFYSDDKGNIIKKTLNSLLYKEDYHVSRFYRENNFKSSIINNVKC